MKNDFDWNTNQAHFKVSIFKNVLSTTEINQDEILILTFWLCLIPAYVYLFYKIKQFSMYSKDVSNK